MQKIVYLSNSRDYTEQGNTNENKYFTHINELLEQGWKVAHVTHNVVEINDDTEPVCKETFVAFVLLEKPEENRKVDSINPNIVNRADKLLEDCLSARFLCGKVIEMEI